MSDTLPPEPDEYEGLQDFNVDDWYAMELEVNPGTTREEFDKFRARLLRRAAGEQTH